MNDRAPEVSIIVGDRSEWEPVRESLRGQSLSAWEIVEGPGAARSGRLVILDGDDRLLDGALRALVAGLEGSPGASVVHGSWLQGGPAGEEESAIEYSDPFVALARGPLVPGCACVMRREAVELAGGLEPHLGAAAAWDLCQRIARLGGPFEAIPEVVAVPRPWSDRRAPDSLSLATEGLAIIERGHAPDRRVEAPAERWANGLGGGGAALAQVEYACWVAGLTTGRGEPWRPILGRLTDAAHGLSPDRAAAALAAGAAAGGGIASRRGAEVWAALEPELDELLDEVERRTGARRAAARTRRALELRAARAGAARAGSCFGTDLEITEPIRDVELPAGAERVVVQIADR